MPSATGFRVAAAVACASILCFSTGSVGASPRRELNAATAPIRLVALGGERVSVAGLHSFYDTIELRTAPDGLVVVNRLPLELYLLGLNEVPSDWPMEALRAQAVAARTYALWTVEHEREEEAAKYRFDICASVECQVFAGADVVSSGDGKRWAAAVRDTEGKVVLYEGAPILARYHSTSGGMTFDNEDAFPEEGSYPFLKGVSSPYERKSPVYRWEVRFTLARVRALLEQAGRWPRGISSLKSVETVRSKSGSPFPDLRLEGKKGSFVVVGDDFRTIARDLAPKLWPGAYPSAADTPSGTLPETLPSERFDVDTRGQVVRFRGRGWGHGVGMSQWGAHGMALAGSTHADILSHYYMGTTVGEADRVGDIEVGVAWAEPSITVFGVFRIVDGSGRTLVERASGTWRFRWRGDDRIAVEPGEIEILRPPPPRQEREGGLSSRERSSDSPSSGAGSAPAKEEDLRSDGGRSFAGVTFFLLILGSTVFAGTIGWWLVRRRSKRT